MELLKKNREEKKYQEVADNIIIVIFVIFAFFSCTSCNKKTGNGNKTVISNDSISHIEYFKESDRVRKIFTIKNDNLFNGYTKEFYPNGKVKLYVTVKDSLWHGAGKRFLGSGELKELAHYRKGKLFGKSEKYYSQGSIKTISYYMNDHILADFYEFDERGQIIGYCFFNTKEKCVFKIRYDQNGKDSITEGDSPIWYAIFADSFKVGENVVRKVYAGTLPNSATEVYELRNDEWIKMTPFPFKSVFTLQHIYSSPGVKEEEVKVIFRDFNGNLIREEILVLPALVTGDDS